MHKWTRSAGAFFVAAASVYAGREIPARAAVGANPATNVKLLEDATPGADATTQPAATNAAAPATRLDVSVEGLVEMHVADADLGTVLRMLGRQTQRNIVPSKNVRGAVTADFYGVTLREALDAILHVNGFAYRESGNFIYVYSAAELAEIEKSERKAVTETFHLYYTPAANAVNLIKPVLSPDAQVAFTTPAVSGLEGGTSNIGGNNHATDDIIVVTDYPDNLAAARRILKEVDERPRQILIEATILRATLNESNKLGVDFAVVGGVDFSTLTGANAAEPLAATGMDQAVDGRIAHSSNPAARTAVENGMIAGTFGGGGLQLGVIKNNIGVFVSALEGVTDTVVLANPKILALNKQKGEVIVGRKDGYLTTTQTESSTVQTVEFLETGTRLIFRPYIGDDGYIRMEIHPEDSSGGLAGEANLPFKVTTEVTSNVMVKDGHTIVIGGLFREDSNSSRSQVPFLGNLPVAGALFRKQTDSTLREEVIILLTPHIVQDVRAYANLSAEELRKAEQLRVGVRRGMMPWGRERLAEIQYNWALDELNKPQPNRQRALWHLNAATNLNVQFREAIELKQELTGQVLTSVGGNGIRGFVQRAILADVAAPSGGPVAPTTAPTTAPILEAPATQPVPSATAELPTDHETALAGEASAVGAPRCDWPAWMLSPFEAYDPEAEVAAGPATQPAAPTAQGPADEPAPIVTITELPVEELLAGDR